MGGYPVGDRIATISGSRGIEDYRESRRAPCRRGSLQAPEEICPCEIEPHAGGPGHPALGQRQAARIDEERHEGHSVEESGTQPRQRCLGPSPTHDSRRAERNRVRWRTQIGVRPIARRQRGVTLKRG